MSAAAAAIDDAREHVVSRARRAVSGRFPTTRSGRSCSTCCSRSRVRASRAPPGAPPSCTRTPGRRRPRIRLSVAKDPCCPPPSGWTPPSRGEEPPPPRRAATVLRAERVDEPVVGADFLLEHAQLLAQTAHVPLERVPARARRPGLRARVLARRLARRQRRGRRLFQLPPPRLRSRAVSWRPRRSSTRCAARHPSPPCPGGCRRRTRPRSVRLRPRP